MLIDLDNYSDYITVTSLGRLDSQIKNDVLIITYYPKL